MTRAEAVHELSTIFGYGFYNERVDEALNMAIKALGQEPKTGEWEYIAHRRELLRRCSNCKWTQTYSNTKYIGYIYKFCPNCGARMESDTE